MYFWNLNALKKDISEKTLSEHQVFTYFFVQFVILGSLGGLLTDPYISGLLNVASNSIDTYITIACALVSILGTLYVYSCNKGKDGVNFFPKFFSLSFVVGIRYAVVALLVLILIYMFLAFILPGSESTTWYDFGIYTIAYIYFFVVLGKNMKSTVVPS